jgi:hypothetical protein
MPFHWNAPPRKTAPLTVYSGSVRSSLFSIGNAGIALLPIASRTGAETEREGYLTDGDAAISSTAGATPAPIDCKSRRSRSCGARRAPGAAARSPPAGAAHSITAAWHRTHDTASQGMERYCWRLAPIRRQSLILETAGKQQRQSRGRQSGIARRCQRHDSARLVQRAIVHRASTPQRLCGALTSGHGKALRARKV